MLWAWSQTIPVYLNGKRHETYPATEQGTTGTTTAEFPCGEVIRDYAATSRMVRFRLEKKHNSYVLALGAWRERSHKYTALLGRIARLHFL